MQRCEQAPLSPIQFQVVCPSPPLLFFFLLGIMMGGTARHDMTSHPSLFSVLRTHERTNTHTHIRVRNQIPPFFPSPQTPSSGSYLLTHTNTETNILYVRLPRLASSRYNDRVRPFCIHYAPQPIFRRDRRRGYTVQHPEGGDLRLAPCGRERETNPSTNQPTPSSSSV
ncbi:hypothetical protein BGY98DRAFT_338756 [Russula aff. rugulosa BPL654]|nr:hypothetical protein BGY98DRAFT_338756 [Russula aff. rugulosa BPL654]